MIRKMKSLELDDCSLDIQQHVITQHGWEYYLEKPDDNGYQFGLVMGVATEMGMVNINEVLPYALSVSVGNELNDIMPAEGWEWSE